MPARLRGPLLASGTVAALGALAVVALQTPSRPATVAATPPPAPAPIVRTVTIHRTVHVVRHVHVKRPAAAAPPPAVAAPAPAPAPAPPRARVAPAAAPPAPRLRTRTSPVARGGEGDDHSGEAEHNDDWVRSPPAAESVAGDRRHAGRVRGGLHPARVASAARGPACGGGAARGDHPPRRRPQGHHRRHRRHPAGDVAEGRRGAGRPLGAGGRRDVAGARGRARAGPGARRHEGIVTGHTVTAPARLRIVPEAQAW